MRVFIDECVHKRVMTHLAGQTSHTFVHILDTTLRSTKNGALLRAVAPDYDVFLTTDRNLRYQQNLRKFPMAFLVLRAKSNDIEDLLPLLPDALIALDAIEASDRAPGELYEIEPR